MDYHLDFLTGREASPKFQAVQGRFNPDRLNDDVLFELLVVTHTDGFNPKNLRWVMGPKWRWRWVADVVEEIGVDGVVGFEDAVKRNTHSITEKDAFVILSLCEAAKGVKVAPPPKWALMALAVRSEGKRKPDWIKKWNKTILTKP